MNPLIVAEGLKNLDQFLALAPQKTVEAARIAINQVADRQGLGTLREAMEDEVAWPVGYLRDPTRFGVSQRATNANLEARIRARSRPTSLARFALNRSSIGRPGVTVRVNKSGGGRNMGKGFLIRLRAGQTLTEENYNLGLAIRLAKGDTIHGKYRMVPFGGGLYLLYGPSVDQVFQITAQEKAAEILDMMTNEFFRQFNRLTGAV